MRLPREWAAEITRNTLPGWEVLHQNTPTLSLGNGTNSPSDGALTAVSTAEAYFGYGITPALLAAGPELRWAHSASAGVTASITPELRASGVVLTNSAGVFSEAMADTVLAGVLHFVRGLDRAVRLQAVQKWDREVFMAEGGLRELADHRVLIVGTGGIGQAVARRFSALGCECVGVRRRVELGAPAGFVRVVPADALSQELPGADVVVLAAPLTAGTRAALDADHLALLPAGAIVVNVARGPLLDAVALLELLDRGGLRGAVLDVFDKEPLSADSPLWRHPRVLITPHVSGVAPGHTWKRSIALFMHNWRQWDAGQPLRNVVDLDAGY